MMETINIPGCVCFSEVIDEGSVGSFSHNFCFVTIRENTSLRSLSEAVACWISENLNITDEI